MSSKFSSLSSHISTAKQGKHNLINKRIIPVFCSFKINSFFKMYRQMPHEEIKSKNKKSNLSIFFPYKVHLWFIPLYTETYTITWIYLTANSKHRRCRPRFEAKSGLRCRGIDPEIPSQGTQPVNYFILLKDKANIEFKISKQNHHKSIDLFYMEIPTGQQETHFLF